MTSGKPSQDRGRHGRAQASASSEDDAAGGGGGGSEEEVRRILSPAKRSKGYDVDGRRRVEEKTWVY